MTIKSVLDISNFKTINEIQSKKEGTVFLIEDINSKNKYVQKIFKTDDISNQSRDELIFKINRISKISKHPGILHVINTIANPNPTVITEYKPNGTIYDFVTKNKNVDNQPFTDTQKFIILIGIINSIRYLDLHHIIFDSINTSNIFLDENLYPQVSFTEIVTKTEEKLDYIQIFPKVVFSFSLIAYEIITGIRINVENKEEYENSDTRPDLSPIKSQWIRDFLQKCWSNMILLRPKFVDVLKDLNLHKSEFGDVNDDEVIKYQTMIDLYLQDYSKTLKKFSKENDFYSIFAYGKMLYHGFGIDVNKEEAVRCFKSASDQGYIFSMYNYAVLLENGDGIEANQDEAIRLYKLAAEKGHINSIYNYAVILDNGKGIQSDKKEAARLYKVAADHGNAYAIYNYAIMLENGEGIEKDQEEAARYYKLGADKGHLNSIYNYANTLYRGEGIVMNKKEAARYFRIAADNGQINAMFNYGIMLYNGYGIEIDKKEAAHYYKIAADKGHVTSMYNIGVMMYNGEGIEVNKEDAARYFKLSADNGNSLAMHNIAILLKNGEGVKMNKKEAAKYFKMAADKGHFNSKKSYIDLTKYTKYTI